MKGPFHKQDAAEKEFSKKFKDKTRNNWDERDAFTAIPGKYTLLDLAESDEEEVSCYISAFVFCYCIQNNKALTKVTVNV